MNKTYIHYGNTVFNPKLIHGPHNNNWNKPKYALWASPENAGYSWSEWCKENDYGSCREDNRFRFRLKNNANVFYIDSLDKARSLPEVSVPNPYLAKYTGIGFYDFDKLKADGYDAVEVSLSDCWQLYDEMYGWDCDSIAVLNPDVVEVISE